LALVCFGGNEEQKNCKKISILPPGVAAGAEMPLALTSGQGRIRSDLSAGRRGEAEVRRAGWRAIDLRNAVWDGAALGSRGSQKQTASKPVDAVC
jgi:hypothetical protein